MMNSLGLYIHIPFCEKRCHYCDFVSISKYQAPIGEYLEALTQELLSFAPVFERYRLATIYIGGGTPSCLSLAESEQLLRLLTPLADDVSEWTLEANPESVTRDKVELWADYGVNRISMGVQSTDPEWLQRLGRLHSVEQVEQAVDTVRSRIDNLNLDLIYGLAPGDQSYMHSLERMIDWEPQHISIYELEVYPHLPLAKIVTELVDSDESYDQFHRLAKRLAEAGYQRYEVSNFARSGFKAQHNQRYWQRASTLGVGLGAHSLLKNKRFHNTADLARYLQGDFVAESEILTPEAELIETIMLGLRMLEGVDYLALKQRYPQYREILAKFVERQMALKRLEIIGSKLRATRLGLDLLDTLVLDFMRCF